MGTIRVVYDCDNTIGIPGRDVDDGLALLYLLGSPSIRLEAVTATYGNGSLEEVMHATRSMFDDLSIVDLPLLKGSSSPGERTSEAAEYLASRVSDEPGTLSVLATGSLTNLRVAHELDPDFFHKVRDIVIMGGVTGELVVGNRVMDELNLSCDPRAAEVLFQSGASLTVVTGNLCLQALLERESYLKHAQPRGPGVYSYLDEKVMPWFGHVETEFGMDGFHVWDVVAAVYLTNPSLFRTKRGRIISSPEELSRGHIRFADPDKNTRTTLPDRILDMDSFWEHVFQAWERVSCGRDHPNARS
jgi:inosine-uridine nucleoside N-ribohydrolase